MKWKALRTTECAFKQQRTSPLWQKAVGLRGPVPRSSCSQHLGFPLQTQDLSWLGLWDRMAWCQEGKPPTGPRLPCSSLLSFERSTQMMDGSSGQDEVRFRVTLWKTRAPAPASTLFICGFGLLETNGAEAVLWASNELFIHPLTLFYWRTQIRLTLEFSAWWVRILWGLSNHFLNFTLGPHLENPWELGRHSKELSILKAL